MPQGPAARFGDPVTPPHVPPVLTGVPAKTVLIGMMPAWKGIPLAAGPALLATSTATESTLQTLETIAKVAEAAALAGAGTPAGPGLAAAATTARVAAETAKATAAATNAASIGAAAATGASMHTCAMLWPLPPHGPGVVIDGSPTVMIDNSPACRMGDTIIEAIGPPNKIMMGCPTVIIGDSGGGGGGGAPAAVPAGAGADPCGKDAISNVTKCCGSEIFDEAKKANGGKDPNIVYGTPSSGFDAETDTSTGTITISDKSDKCTATESVYFELANMAAKPTFDKIAADAAAGKTSREDYAKANEKVEYENMKKANAAIDKCKKKWGCEAHTFSFDSFRPATDFDDYYDHYLAESHKNHYRNYWDSAYKAAYDASHPPAPAGP